MTINTVDMNERYIWVYDEFFKSQLQIYYPSSEYVSPDTYVRDPYDMYHQNVIIKRSESSHNSQIFLYVRNNKIYTR